MEKFFNNGSMTTKFHILNVQEELRGHAKDGRCASSRNQEIPRNLGKQVEKQTLVCLSSYDVFRKCEIFIKREMFSTRDRKMHRFDNCDDGIEKRLIDNKQTVKTCTSMFQPVSVLNYFN